MSQQSTTELSLTPAEIQKIRRLLDEDEIRSLALFYSHYQDHSYLDRLRTVFTEDVRCEFGPYGTWEGCETVITNLGEVNRQMGGRPFMAMHANTLHWIEWLDPDHAIGRRQLLDFQLTRTPEENPLLWLGLYEDRYRRTAAGWRIEVMRLDFLWPERLVVDGFPGEFPPASVA
jgi:hypothetical protein